MRQEVGFGQDPKPLMAKIGKIGTRVLIKVEYLDQIPSR